MSDTVPIRETSSRTAFAAQALEMLLERIARNTRELELLRREVERESPAGSADDAPRDLGDVALELDGWLFGILALELGSDVLFERRERQGLRHVLELVGEMLARDGIPWSLPALPELDSADPRCNAICAVVARAVHAAHGACGRVDWSFTREARSTALRFAGVGDEHLHRVLVQGAARIDGARAIRDAASTRLVLPEGSLVWP
ncbi:MAG TPA: hypothetical protein VM509_13345 [Planctomycetota bacterium]|nr:hypothetical protein [Planctomycetota bacterium]